MKRSFLDNQVSLKTRFEGAELGWVSLNLDFNYITFLNYVISPDGFYKTF